MKTTVKSSSTKRLNRPIAILVALGILATLPGCFIPKLRGPLGSQSVPQDFFLPDEFSGPTGAENSANLSPMDFFNDPYLIGLIDQALVGNQELRILAEDIQIANNEVLRRRGAYLPFLSFGSGAKLEKLSGWTVPGAELNDVRTPTGGNFPNPLPNFLSAADVSWQVDIWRQLRNARDAQGLRYLGTIDGRNYVVTRVVAEVAENYYKLLSLDKQLETLDRTIALQEQSLELAQARKQAARDTELPVQRFEAEVRKNQSQKLIIRQNIIETENRINFLAGRFPQPVQRMNLDYLNLELNPVQVGVPSQLLLNRPDIRQAERELQAAGLDIRVARADFFPKVFITSGIGLEAFNARYLFSTPESLVYNVAGSLVAPLVNRSAIKADYMNANARQLQALYDYQRTILTAFTEVVNQVSKVQNYSQSIQLKKQQLESLESAVNVAGNLFQNARVEYVDVLFAQRDRNEARMVLLETKQEQLAAIVNAYQALGGGWQRPRVISSTEVATPPGEIVPTPAGVEGVPAPNPNDPNAPVPPAPVLNPNGLNPNGPVPAGLMPNPGAPAGPGLNGGVAVPPGDVNQAVFVPTVDPSGNAFAPPPILNDSGSVQGPPIPVIEPVPMQ